MDERPSHRLLTPRVLSSGRNVGIERGVGQEISSGYRRKSHTHDGGDGGESIGDIAGREVVVQYIYGIGEGLHERPPMGITSLAR